MSSCIIWTNGWMAGGYGRGPGGMLAHRYVWTQNFGEIPPGFIIHHICETKDCVNLEHLQMMTHSEHSRLHDNPRSARLARRAATHCKHGHEFSEQNTWRAKDGRRYCRACDRERHRAAALLKRFA